jgi:hypothetical protein
LPFAVCEVGRAAAAVAWCAANFDDAPPVVNLVDPAIRTRGELVKVFRSHRWRGRVFWFPISVLAAAVRVAGMLTSVTRRERARPLAVWSILQPRHYDLAVATAVLAAADHSGPPAPSPTDAPRAEQLSGTYA